MVDEGVKLVVPEFFVRTRHHAFEQFDVPIIDDDGDMWMAMVIQPFDDWNSQNFKFVSFLFCQIHSIFPLG
jgi:hypothetical protein